MFWVRHLCYNADGLEREFSMELESVLMRRMFVLLIGLSASCGWATIESVHGRFYNRGAEICLRFIHNYFRDGYGHLGDADAR